MERTFEYMVSTQCFTYNQAPYIEDTLRGFAMQETSFPVVNIIVDDASTDKEPEVLRKWVHNNLLIDKGEEKWRILPYGELAVGKLKKNIKSTFVVLLLNENHYQRGLKQKRLEYISEWKVNAKYHALCEGDDYWIHPMKLQCQVDFMESHPEYSMCFNNALVTYDGMNKPARIFNQIGKDQEIGLEQLIDKWICPTPGILMRSSILPLYTVKGSIISGDWRRTLHCAACGKVWAMKAVMSCYRKTGNETSLSNMVSHRSDETFLKKVTILEGLDDYTVGRYHNLIGKYIRYYKVFGSLIQFKKRHGIIATLIMRPFSVIEILWKRYLRPKFNGKAPSFSA